MHDIRVRSRDAVPRDLEKEFPDMLVYASSLE